MKLYLIGVRNLVIEVDARYIKGMLRNPDLHPGASINRWILAILTFHFHLVHVPGTHHGPDGLSRRRPQPGDDPDPPDDIDDWVDELYGFMHMINTDYPICHRSHVLRSLFPKLPILPFHRTKEQSRLMAMCREQSKPSWMMIALS
jgi:hypothetical protein